MLMDKAPLSLPERSRHELYGRIKMFKKTRSKSMIVLVSFCLLLFLSRNALADGLIVVPSTIDTVSSFPLEVRYHHVEVTIKNQTALTMVDQEFYNPTGRRLEGTYLFPSPTER